MLKINLHDMSIIPSTAARILGCSARTVERMCARGDFRTAARSFGGRWTISRLEVYEVKQYATTRHVHLKE